MFLNLRYLINDVVHYCKRKEGDALLATLVAKFEVRALHSRISKNNNTKRKRNIIKSTLPPP